MAWEDIVKQKGAFPQRFAGSERPSRPTPRQKINQKYPMNRFEFIEDVNSFVKRYKKHVMPQFGSANNGKAIDLLEDLLEDVQMELKRTKELAKLPKDLQDDSLRQER